MIAVSPAKSARPPAPSATAGIMTSREGGTPAPLSTPSNEPRRCALEPSAPPMKPVTTSLHVPAAPEQQQLVFSYQSHPELVPLQLW